MGHRRRSQVPERIAIWTVLIGLLALGISKVNVELISWVVVIGCGYELFIGKTQCRVSKVGGGACRNNTRGRLRGSRASFRLARSAYRRCAASGPNSP